MHACDWNTVECTYLSDDDEVEDKDGNGDGDGVTEPKISLHTICCMR